MPPTQPDPNEVMRVKHAKLHPGPTNRLMRSGMDAKSLGELADSIIAQGIVQPLIIRTHRETGEFEIVCGERRHAAFGVALKKAKLKDEVPCLFREYTDAQVHEVRLIENVQREGIHELEEAAGYRELLELKDEKLRPVHTINTLAAKIGKSVAFIYGRIKLLDTPELAQSAMATGKLTASNALLIARIPDPKLAHKATLEILNAQDETQALDPNIAPLSYREAQAHISQHYMIRLKGAPFDQEDELLVPIYYAPVEGNELKEVRIGGGSCSHCPFRTGNMKAQGVETDSADVCTNTACFKKKKEATFKAEKDRLAEKGQTLLTPNAAEKLLNFDGTALADHARSQYVDLREPLSGIKGVKKGDTWEDVLEEHLPADAPVMVARGKKNLLLMPVEVVAAAAKKAGLKFESPKPVQAYNREAEQQKQIEREEKKEASKLIVEAAFEQLMKAVTNGKTDLAFLRLVASACCGHAYTERRQFTSDKARTKHFEALNEAGCRMAIIEGIWFQRPVDFNGELNDEFQAICETYGVDLKQIAKETKSEKK